MLASWPRLAYVAGAVTLANVPIHVHWAMGGTFWLPGGASVAALPETRTANWAVSAVLLMGAGALVLIGAAWSRHAWVRNRWRLIPALILTALGIGAVVCMSHALYGFATKGLYLAGYDTVDYPDIGDGWSYAEKQSAAVLDLAVFEPWFLLEGVLLTLVGRQLFRTARHRRLWTAGVTGGTLAITLLGAILALAGARLAIGLGGGHPGGLEAPPSRGSQWCSGWGSRGCCGGSRLSGHRYSDSRTRHAEPVRAVVVDLRSLRRSPPGCWQGVVRHRAHPYRPGRWRHAACRIGCPK